MCKVYLESRWWWLDLSCGTMTAIQLLFHSISSTCPTKKNGPPLYWKLSVWIRWSMAINCPYFASESVNDTTSRPQRCKIDMIKIHILQERFLRYMPSRFGILNSTWILNLKFERKPNLNLNPSNWILNSNLDLNLDVHLYLQVAWRFFHWMSCTSNFVNQDIPAKWLTPSYKSDHSVALYNNLYCTRFVQELRPCTRL